MSRRLPMIAASLALTLVLVGCGSDDDSTDDDRDTTTTEEGSTTTAADDEATTEDTTAPEEPTESTEATEPPDTTEPPENTGDGDEDFCATYARFEESFEELPDDSVEDIQQGIEALHDALDELAGVAPDEIAAPAQELTVAGDELVDAVADVATVEEAMTAVTDVFTNEEFNTAAEAVDDYFDERCPQADDDQAEAETPEIETPETVTPG